MDSYLCFSALVLIGLCAYLFVARVKVWWICRNSTEQAVMPWGHLFTYGIMISVAFAVNVVVFLEFITKISGKRLSVVARYANSILGNNGVTVDEINQILEYVDKMILSIGAELYTLFAVVAAVHVLLSLFEVLFPKVAIPSVPQKVTNPPNS